MNDIKPLNEYILDRRTDRLDEWSMDQLARDVKKLEDSVSRLEQIITDQKSTLDLFKGVIPVSKLEELVNNADASLWGFMESVQKLIDDNKE